MENYNNKIIALLGPTNTGKTHVSIEKMLQFESGIFGLPLRLLAREVYDKCVKKVGTEKVALITGEEKIIPSTASYFICTVESMPKDKQVDFIAIDEIQMCADRERGHVFTDRLLHARGKKMTMFLGSQVMTNIINDLIKDVEFQKKDRLSNLSYTGYKKISRLDRKVAIITFSIEEVYAIAELVRRQKGGAAIIMGSLSPKTRNSQVGLYQSGDVDYLIATDAIGMGLNMDINEIYFSNLKKFDGKKTRRLNLIEMSQIAGRAGRFKNDGKFGTTGDCENLNSDEIEKIEKTRNEKEKTEGDNVFVEAPPEDGKKSNKKVAEIDQASVIEESFEQLTEQNYSQNQIINPDIEKVVVAKEADVKFPETASSVIVEKDFSLAPEKNITSIKVYDDCWLEVFTEDERLLYVLSKSGEEHIFKENRLKIIAGNFKNIEISFNDKMISLGDYANKNNVSCIVLPAGDCSEFRTPNN